jgi:hypothetical protein
MVSLENSSKKVITLGSSCKKEPDSWDHICIVVLGVKQVLRLLYSDFCPLQQANQMVDLWKVEDCSGMRYVACPVLLGESLKV